MKSGLWQGLAVLAATAAVLAPAPRASAQAQEKCYGVAPAGKNEGIGADAVAGGATVNYQGDAWISVPRGTCLTIALPVQPDGTPRRGALEPIARDQP